MNTGLSILGFGCVTSHGNNWETVWERICNRESPPREILTGPGGLSPVEVFKVARPEIPSAIGARLRRSSSISYYACVAAADAVQQAGPLPDGRTALVFATSNGSVVYTQRFYGEVVARGAGSPLLFPETVYNAPASHVAAMLGLDGTVLTLVSDSTAGTNALSTAADLIQSGMADRCLVVAAEELDWISCEGYRRWKLASPVGQKQGAILSEGAVAMLLGPGSSDGVQIIRVHPGKSIGRVAGAAPVLRNLLGELAGGEIPDLVVLSSSGARPGVIEESIVREIFPTARLLAPNRFVGEAFAMSVFLQCLCARQEICRGSAGQVLVSVLGWHGQAGGAFLTALS